MDPDEPIGALGEFGVIAELGKIFSSVEGGTVGIGDDTAVLPPPPKGREQLLTVDAQIEGIHFERSWAIARLLGRKALAINLSDVAAMGGEPRWAVLAVAAPATLPWSWMRDLAQGFAQSAHEHAVAVVGGNLSGGERVAATVTVVGEVEAGRAVRRAGGRPGDRLYLSGSVGAAAMGLALVQGAALPAAEPVGEMLRGAFLDPRPRLPEGRLAAGFARAMIDLSDGFLGDLGHLCAASGCGARVELGRIPFPPGAEPVAAALWADPELERLRGGEDYGLLCAVASEVAPAFEERVIQEGASFHQVGVLQSQPGVLLVREDGRRVQEPARAFEHFR